MKPQKIYWPLGLGPRKYIWITWAQKIYPAISPEPWLQFSQTRPHFLKNHEMNPIKLWNIKKLIDLAAWSLETTFGLLGPRRHVEPYISPEPWLQFSQARPHFLKNHEMNSIKSCYLKKFLDLWVWGLETTYWAISSTLTQIFTNRTSFSQEFSILCHFFNQPWFSLP